MPGRKPKPTALKIFNGNPGHKPLNKREPKPRQALPRCPAHLDDVAKREWRRIIREVRHIGMITALDRVGLAVYCVLWSRWVAAEIKLAETGLVIVTKSGNVIQNPLLGVANRAQAELRRWAVEYGMTPSSRSRVNVPETIGEDEFSAFLNKRSNLKDGTDNG